MNKLEKRLQNIICLNAQNIDDADAVKSEDGVDATTELSADEKLRNRENTKKIWKGVISPDINCGHGLNNVADDGHLNKNKIRRHLPPGSGKYSVGCVDIMNDNNEEGIFCRLFYPVEKTDIFVSIIICVWLECSILKAFCFAPEVLYCYQRDHWGDHFCVVFQSVCEEDFVGLCQQMTRVFKGK